MASLIGPGFDQRLVNRLIRQALETGSISVKNNQQVFGFLDVEDAARGILSLADFPAERWKECYNLGIGTGYRLTEIAAAVQEVLRSKYGVETAADVQDGDERLNTAVNAERIAAETGFVPCISLHQSIEKIAAAEGFAAGLDEKGNVVRWSAMEELELFYDGRSGGSWRDIRQLTASESILAGIDGQGRVLAAGVPEEWIEEIGRLRGAKQVSAAGDRLLVLSKTGEARLWAADAEEWDLLPLQGAAEAVLGQNGILARMPDGTARAAAAAGK